MHSFLISAGWVILPHCQFALQRVCDVHTYKILTECHVYIQCCALTSLQLEADWLKRGGVLGCAKLRNVVTRLCDLF